MSKPDWKDAPEWAQWVARDADGRWVWHQTRPTPHTLARGWVSEGRSKEVWPNLDGWRQTLEPRP